MTPKKIGAGILGTTALVFGGVDASKLDEQPIERIETVAGYTVEAKQIENRVETSFPWKDQPAIKVVYDMGQPTLAEKFKDKRKKEVVTEAVNFGDGGFKVDILLDEKPDTNVFCYAIQGAENYDFFYQPPLTEQEIAEGASRPPEIDGSYAVYHKTLKNHQIGKENYATGKVMHIPRPQVWSMSDVETKVWADMNYDNENLCVTVPQDFLDKAEYPVRVDPTFGYTTQGTTGSVGLNASITYFASLVGSFVASSGDTVTSFTLYGNKGAGANTNANVALFSVVAGVVSTQLANGVSIPITGSDSWWSSGTVSQSLVAGTQYAIAVSGELAPNGIQIVAIWYDNGTAPGRFNSTLTVLPGAGGSFSPTGTDSGRHYSIYATYTAAAATANPNQNIILFE